MYLDSGNEVTRFNDNRSRKDWVFDFMKRHKDELSMRTSELFAVAQARGLKDVLKAFFTMVTNFFNDNEISLTNDATHIYNLDETGLTLEPIKKKFLHEKGSKDMLRVVPSEGKSMYTVLVCGNAAGEYLPPYVLFKGTG